MKKQEKKIPTNMRVISRTSVFVSGTLEHVHNLALKTPLYKNTRLAELGCFVHRSEHRTPPALIRILKNP